MQGVILWAGLLLVLLVLFAVTVRRLSVLIARTRDLERFQRTVASLDARLAATVEPLVTSLDEIRRRSGDPNALAERLGTWQDALHALAAEGHGLRVPRGLTDKAAALVAELDRATRAADLVEHGLAALIADRGGRELEAQTSLKRAALNLRHARTAVGDLAVAIAAVRPADLLARPGGRGAAVPVPAAGPYGADGLDGDDGGALYPRM